MSNLVHFNIEKEKELKLSLAGFAIGRAGLAE